MKRIVLFIIFMVSLFFIVDLSAQEIDVLPGYGTLNDAINANGGNKIYKLQAGGWYGLNAIIEDSLGLTIVGTTPVPGQMPAILQTGSTSSGGTFSWMFELYADLTIKNVFLVNADLNNAEAGHLLVGRSSSRIVLDSVTIDPTASFALLEVAPSVGVCELYITNSLIMQHGNNTDLFDGFEFLTDQSSGWDTVYVENNTFVNTGLSFFMSNNPWQRGTPATYRDKFLWFNHNTIMFAKQNLIGSYLYDSEFFTNNLLFMVGFVPFTNEPPGVWFNNYGDMGPKNSITCLVPMDTLMPGQESFPSQRKSFVEYNSNYLDSRLNNIVKLGVDSGFVTYLLNIANSPSMKDSSREAWMLSDKTDFPYFMAGNNSENMDPKFTNQKIYDVADSAVIWAKYAAEFKDWGFPSGSYPDPSTWPLIFYRADSALGYPTTWPRFDGTYSNSQLLTGSIEGLPLGDLNWFPAQKAIWQKNQASVMTHILSEDESVINLTDVKKENNQTPTAFTLSQNYPNPFNPSTIIKYSIPKSGIVTLKVYNMLGQEVATLVNQMQKSGNYIVNFNANKLASGVYMYRIQSGDFTLTKKMELLK